MLFTFNYAVAQDFKVNLFPCYSRYQNYLMMKTPAPAAYHDGPGHTITSTSSHRRNLHSNRDLIKLFPQKVVAHNFCDHYANQFIFKVYSHFIIIAQRNPENLSLSDKYFHNIIRFY